MQAAKIKVSGVVQGVFFRKHTKDKAEELGVKGTVCNLDDGSVEIRAEAPESTLNAFISWCKIGPSRARVDQIEVKEMPVENYPDFKIIR